MKNNVLIKEIFKSIQGEGLYVGVSQLFIRFTKCNLNCIYCDTDFKTNSKEYNANELACIVNEINNIHSISLTGGEPLTETEFLLEFLPKMKHKIYLETNGILYEQLQKVIKYIDIISMDIKLPSCSKNKDLFKEHENFIQIAKAKELFVKVVFDENINDSEIKKCCELGIKYKMPVILQPKMNGEILEIKSEFINRTFYRFNERYENIRLIPQVHKFLNVK